MVRTTTSHAVILLVLLAVTAAVYAPLVQAPFVYEDANWMPQAQIRTAVFTAPPSRALTQATYYWTYSYFNFNPGPWHLTEIGLHLVNGTLVYAVAATLVGPTVALGSAGLFLLHPLNSEAVSYVSARTDLLSTMFVLVAVLLALGSGGWWWRMVGCAVSLALAAMSKEIGVVGVPLVLLSVVLWRRASVPRLSFLVTVLWVLLGAMIGALWDQVHAYLTMSSSTSGSSVSVQEYAVLQAALVWKFLVMVMWPTGLTVDHDVAAFGLTWLALSAVGIGAALIVAVVAWRRAPMVTWTIGWVALALAPRFMVRSGEFLNEHQVYLAMIGAWIGIATLSARLWGWVVSDDDAKFWEMYHAQQRVGVL